MAPKTCLIMIFLLLSVLYTAEPAHSAPAMIPPKAASNLEDRLKKAKDAFINWLSNERNVSEFAQTNCEKKFNESIDALEVTLNKTATLNNLTSFIDNWVEEAENNRTNCTISYPTKNGASNVQFSFIPYALCSLLYFAFLLLVSPIFSGI